MGFLSDIDPHQMNQTNITTINTEWNNFYLRIKKQNKKKIF